MDRQISFKEHTWSGLPTKESKARRSCTKCHVIDRIVGIKWVVTWPCIEISEAWTYEDLVCILHYCQVDESYISLIKLYPESPTNKKFIKGPYRVGIQIPGVNGFELYPTLEPSPSEEIACKRFFQWLVHIEFDLQKDPQFNEMLRQKAYR